MLSKKIFHKWWFWTGLIIALVLLVILIVTRVVNVFTDQSIAVDKFFQDPSHQETIQLDGFPVYEQKFANSCGPTTISMVYTWLVNPIDEIQIAEKLGREPGKKGMLPGEFSSALQAVLKEHGYVIRHLSNISDSAFLDAVDSQLRAGVPVPIYFSTENAWDMPNFDTHYSAITGYDGQERMFYIANAYGFLQEVSADDLLDSMKYKNYQNPPFEFRMGRLLGLIKPVNIYLIEKQ